MARICDWCGKKVGFSELFDTEEVESKTYLLCSKCCEDVAAAKKGFTTFDEIKTAETNPILFNYYAQPEKVADAIVKQNQHIQAQSKAKKAAREKDPLYDDVHQIAEDVRFIKNYILISCICTFITSLFLLLSLLL